MFLNPLGRYRTIKDDMYTTLPCPERKNVTSYTTASLIASQLDHHTPRRKNEVGVGLTKPSYTPTVHYPHRSPDRFPNARPTHMYVALHLRLPHKPSHAPPLQLPIGTSFDDPTGGNSASFRALTLCFTGVCKVLQVFAGWWGNRSSLPREKIRIIVPWQE